MILAIFASTGNNEHVYSHKAAQIGEKQHKTAIYSLAYIYIKEVVHQINS